MGVSDYRTRVQVVDPDSVELEVRARRSLREWRIITGALRGALKGGEYHPISADFGNEIEGVIRRFIAEMPYEKEA